MSFMTYELYVFASVCVTALEGLYHGSYQNVIMMNEMCIIASVCVTALEGQYHGSAQNVIITNEICISASVCATACVGQYHDNWKLDCLTEDEVDWVNANCVVVHVDQPVFVAVTGTKRASTA